MGGKSVLANLLWAWGVKLKYETASKLLCSKGTGGQNILAQLDF